MTRVLFTAAFLLGCMVVLWIASGFLGTDITALTVTVIIGAVYIIGFIEQLKFREATSTLAGSLENIPKNITVLDEWLINLHPSLQNTVRLRIEGEKVGLPGAVLTPYLVGLLVMLGLLGTFVGMVVTLKGAVFALEGTTELQAIRAGLAAPIEGLGLAFGTSVAGVAASAMLGLISTLNKRDRIFAIRLLDRAISTDFRDFSLTYNRQETYKALQHQAQALPQVAEKLDAMASQLERMSVNLADKLIANQDHFHTSVKNVYSELAVSVDQSLKASLAESGRLAGESIKPIVEDAMAAIAKEAESTHQKITVTAQTQMEYLSKQFTQTTEAVTQAWQSGLAGHQRANEVLVEGMGQSFEAFNQQFSQGSASWLELQANADKDRLGAWTSASENMQNQTIKQVQVASSQYVGELKQVADLQQSSFDKLAQGLETTTEKLASEWKQVTAYSLDQQKGVSDTLQETVTRLSENSQNASTQMIEKVGHLLSATETVVETRAASEAAWLNSQGERMAELSATFGAFNQQFANATVSWLEQQEQADGDRLSAWVARADDIHIKTTAQMQDTSNVLVEELRRVTDNAQTLSTQLLAKVTDLLSASEKVIDTRIASEATWFDEYGERMVGMSTAFDTFNQQFANATVSWTQQQEKADGERLNAWLASAQDMQNRSAAHVQEASTLLVGELTRVTDEQKASLAELTQSLQSTTATISNEWKQSADHSFEQQQKICGSLQESANSIADHAQSTSTQMIEKIGHLLSATEQVIETRIASEASWLSGHGERMAELTAALKAELTELRTAESQRGDAAVARLADLESAVASHITTLGQTLEEPMSRLILLASETPKAAAEVITKLRGEITNNTERDNVLLAERVRIMEDLSALLSSLEQTSAGQCDAIESLVNSSASLLTDVGGRFSDHVGSEVSKLSEIADHFSSSSTEIASLGEAFGFAVELFNESNEKLIDNLNRIEESMDKSTARSDEQLAYYVAQAREIIDHSMMSQKEIFEELRLVNQKEPHSSGEAK